MPHPDLSEAVLLLDSEPDREKLLDHLGVRTGRDRKPANVHALDLDHYHVAWTLRTASRFDAMGLRPRI